MFNDKTYRLMKLAAKTTVQNDRTEEAQDAGIKGTRDALKILDDASSQAIPKIKTVTYTPASFRKHIYSLLHKVIDGKENIQITMKSKGHESNDDVMVVNKGWWDKLVHQTRNLKSELKEY